MSTIERVLTRTVDLPKRTRTNVQQSKAGCFTCRARRKKCGEEKPCCQRCLKARITCQGYHHIDVDRSDRKSSSANENDTKTLTTKLCPSPSNPGRTRLFALGLELLFQESCTGSMLAGSKFWTYTIPQLAVINESVHVAVSSMGATYEATVLGFDVSNNLAHCRALHFYRLALSKLRSTLVVHAGELLPVFVASVILAAVEVLQNNLENASLHINGAFALLQQHPSVRLTAPQESLKPKQADATETKNVSETIDRKLYVFAQALDIQIAAFALGSPLRLAPMPHWSATQGLDHEPSETFLEFASTQLMSLIHSCFNFTSVAASYKYAAPSNIPCEMTIQQSHYIAQLLQWLQILRRYITQTLEKTLLMLQAHCLSTMIYVSTVLNAYEGAYDAHLTSFHDITVAASSVLLQQPNETLATPPHRFRLLVSLAQPLYFSAVKCRDRKTRRDALKLLRLTGREGPWNSHIHAAVAQRVIEVEEEFSAELRRAAGSDVSSSEAPCGILERARICGSGVQQETQLAACPRSVTVSLSRCVDVDRMLHTPSTPWDASENWEIWSETVSLD